MIGFLGGFSKRTRYLSNLLFIIRPSEHVRDLGSSLKSDGTKQGGLGLRRHSRSKLAMFRKSGSTGLNDHWKAVLKVYEASLLDQRQSRAWYKSLKTECLEQHEPSFN